MMKFISNCNELNPKGTSSIIEDSNGNVDDKKKGLILDYLKNGIDAGVRCSVVVDRITGDRLPQTIHRYKDDEYIWTDEDIYHYEKYNIKLFDEFINKVVLSNPK